jgi:hypothetical protein
MSKFLSFMHLPLRLNSTTELERIALTCSIIRFNDFIHGLKNNLDWGSVLSTLTALGIALDELQLVSFRFETPFALASEILRRNMRGLGGPATVIEGLQTEVVRIGSCASRGDKR